MESAENRVKEIVAEQLGLAADEIPADASFSSDLGADTLDMIELIMALEEEFDIEITDGEAESIRCVQDAVDFLSARLQ
ncbi:MAG: acyl carrier protein [Proteobacteria bacterium]|nr:acyl carrier protein [Pseudomonadota bacterium]